MGKVVEWTLWFPEGQWRPVDQKHKALTGSATVSGRLDAGHAHRSGGPSVMAPCATEGVREDFGWRYNRNYAPG